jgi:chemotaxis signal transduction protein
MEWLAFQVGKEVLGIDASYIYRVVDDAKVTPVPFAPECHLGLTYYRGELFNVIDMVSLLDVGKRNSETELTLILIKWSDKKLALVSGDIIGLLWIEDEIEDRSSYETEDYTVKRVTPEFIWSRLVKKSHGPD